MLRSTLILLHVATMLISTQASLGKIWGIESRGNISVTTTDSALYAVSKNKTHIIIQSNVESYQQCDLEFNNTHMGKIQVAGIEGKILLVFRLNSTTIQMLQLDPVLCLYTPLPYLEISRESLFEPKLIVLGDTLDVFVNDSNCHPCRLDVNGKRLDVTGQLDDSKFWSFESFIVVEFIQKGVVRNYVLAGNFYNGSSVLMLLDHNFNRIKDAYFAYHQIEALAANSVSNNQSVIGITYAGLGSPYERVLAMYTDDLELIYEIRVKHKTGDRILVTLLSINSRGQACVYSQQKAPWDSYRYMNYAIYNLKGGLVGSGQYDNLRADIKHDWQLLRRNNDFCYVFHWEQEPLTRTNVVCYSDAYL